MPSPLLVTDPRLPPVVNNTTVPPLVVRWLPFASSAWTVIVEVDTPSAEIEVGLAEMTVFAAETDPAVKVTAAVWVIEVESVESVAV